MSAQDELREQLAAGLDRIRREQPKQETVITCPDCNGDGFHINGGPANPPIICLSCNGQRVIVITT